MSIAVSKSLPKKLVLFLDTNIFIEAKDLPQVPWDELATSEITLLVCAAVRQEIDGHKTSDKNRVRKRALEWNSEFKKLLRPGAPPLVLREKSPHVRLAMAPQSSGEPAHGSLDLKEPDDQLVDATLKYRDSHSGEEVRLFTDDTGPIGKAYETVLAFIDLPVHWRRDPGPSDDQKEIARLRQDNERLRSEYTSISARLQAESGSIIGGIEVPFPWYPELKSDQIGELINFANELLTTSLDIECRRNNYTPLLRHPARERLQAQQEKWAQELRIFLGQLLTIKDEQIESQIFTLVLSCDGVRPADNTKVSIDAKGTVLLAAGEPVVWNREIKIPTPPSLLQQRPSPRPSQAPGYQLVVDLRFRKPDVFYRDTHPPGRCSRLEYSCPELTHKGAESSIEFRIKPASDSKNGPMACCNTPSEPEIFPTRFRSNSASRSRSLTKTPSLLQRSS